MSEENTLETVELVQEKHLKDDWSGGKVPMDMSYGKTMMWYFLLSDAFTFSAFLISYGTLRVSASWWPNPNEVFNKMPVISDIWPHMEIPMGFVSIMTFVLILSSVFVVRAVQEGHRMNRKGVMFWMSLGILGGLAFLGCQAWEWTNLIHEGLTPTYNPFGPEGLVGHTHGAETLGPSIFGALFFAITGFHGFHVLSGVCFNIWGFIMTANGNFERRGHYEMIEKLGLYWHFVDLVWVFVFLAFYLL